MVAQLPRASERGWAAGGLGSTCDRVRLNNQCVTGVLYLVCLAMTTSYGDDAIRQAASQPLETWPNPAPDRDYLIHLEHPEFTALCPRSGYPDFGTIVLDYYPGDWVVELKAFKLYINSYRDERVSHEAVVNRIADRLMRDVQPKALRAIGDFTRRGNVKTTIAVQLGADYKFPDYQAQTL